MPRPDNPTLPGENWEGFREFREVGYAPASWNSRHWVCPNCGEVSTVLKSSCWNCPGKREKKVVGFNRLGNPVQKWVMRVQV